MAKEKSKARICFEMYKEEFVTRFGEKGYKDFKTKIFGELMHKVNDASTDKDYANRGEKALYLEATYLEHELQKVMSTDEFSIMIRKGVAKMLERDIKDMRGDWRQFNQEALERMQKSIEEDEAFIYTNTDALINGEDSDNV
ncbi:MAG: hypothetical protein J6S67_01450 [Methanobrevibacter sp.]|nr:hypothetical protein [Methanobrevibacter sp.]